jgi:hypothetical protein
MSLIKDTVYSHLPYKRKTTPSGWISFNAVCCHHNGTSQDSRQRGGIIFNGDGVSYHCFNCQFKTSWQRGRSITPKFRKLLLWLGVNDDLITKCALESLRTKDDDTHKEYKSNLPVFIDKSLPKGARLIIDYLDDPPADLMPVLEYLKKRNLYLEDYPFYWTEEDNLKNRLIIPYYYQGRIVGYTCRKITDGKPKYISAQQPGFVFNLDRQNLDNKFVIVCEGQIDAITINGVAVMSSEINDQQRKIIDNLKRDVIVVPDRDYDGLKLVHQAIEFGWTVSFPDWGDIKDINESSVKYNRLTTLYKIITNVERTELKIRLQARQWFRGYTNV